MQPLSAVFSSLAHSGVKSRYPADKTRPTIRPGSMPPSPPETPNPPTTPTPSPN